jgi:hypothetical protein
LSPESTSIPGGSTKNAHDNVGAFFAALLDSGADGPPFETGVEARRPHVAWANGDSTVLHRYHSQVNGNHFASLLTALAQARIRFVVAGGVAVVMHGVERMTMDIDVAVDFEPDNLARFVEEMKRLGMQPRVPVPHDFICDPANVQRMIEEKSALVFTYIHPDDPLKQIDVFLTPELSYSALIGDSVVRLIFGTEVRVASVASLLRLKRGVDPRRPKDDFDIVELEKLINDG